MSLPKKSLKVLKGLLSKEQDLLNQIEVDLAKKHLLNLYEYFNDIDVKQVEMTNSHRNKSSKINEDTQGLFDQLFNDPSSTYEEGIDDRVENEKPISLEEGNSIVEESMEKPSSELIFEEEKNEHKYEEEEEISESLNSIEEENLKAGEVEDNLIKPEIDSISNMGSLSDQIQVAFEPPLSEGDFLAMWTPSEEASTILDEPTKSGFKDVSEDLNFQKKEASRGDIRSLIGINDRYLYSNELFHSKSVYEETLDQLNSMSDLENALKYLEQHLPQESIDVDQQIAADEVYQSFIHLLERYYGSF